MLEGRFINGAPRLPGNLLIPSLGIDANVLFLVDTGADETALMPADGQKLNLPYAALGKAEPIDGLGGAVEACSVAALLSFLGTDRRLYSYATKIQIIKAQEDRAQLPSLLGRDVLNHWAMTYNAKADSLRFEVLFADKIIALPK